MPQQGMQRTAPGPHLTTKSSPVAPAYLEHQQIDNNIEEQKDTGYCNQEATEKLLYGNGKTIKVQGDAVELEPVLEPV